MDMDGKEERKDERGSHEITDRLFSLAGAKSWRSVPLCEQESHLF